MRFSQWMEEYESDHQAGVESAAVNREFPFSHWFTNENLREYLPLQRKKVNSQDEMQVANLLRQFHGRIPGYPESPQGYAIINYQKGLAAPASNPKRLLSIGRILNVIAKNQDIANVIKAFQNSPARTAKNEDNYMVVISGNIHDIAKMSTDRNWTSCLSLDKNPLMDSKRRIYCEVKKGGLIAYLTTPEDKNIKNPLARIWIRHLRNKAGQSVAMLEDSHYGNDIPGFRQTVEKWLRSKQGKIQPGFYKLKGAKYSDTFLDDRGNLFANPKDVVSLAVKYFGTAKATPIFKALGELAERRKIPEELVEKYIKPMVLKMVNYNHHFSSTLHNYYHLFKWEEVKNLPLSAQASWVHDSESRKLVLGGAKKQYLDHIISAKNKIKNHSDPEDDISNITILNTFLTSRKVNLGRTTLLSLIDLYHLVDNRKKLHLTSPIIDAMVKNKYYDDKILLDMVTRKSIVDFVVNDEVADYFSHIRNKKPFIDLFNDNIELFQSTKSSLPQWQRGYNDKRIEELKKLVDAMSNVKEQLTAYVEPPVPSSSKSPLNMHQKIMLKKYIKDRLLDDEDLSSIEKGMDNGMSFQDALSVASQEHNHRRQMNLQMRS